LTRSADLYWSLELVLTTLLDGTQKGNVSSADDLAFVVLSKQNFICFAHDLSFSLSLLNLRRTLEGYGQGLEL
jgi:hypothetical protein